MDVSALSPGLPIECHGGDFGFYAAKCMGRLQILLEKYIAKTGRSFSNFIEIRLRKF